MILLKTESSCYSRTVLRCREVVLVPAGIILDDRYVYRTSPTWSAEHLSHFSYSSMMESGAPAQLPLSMVDNKMEAELRCVDFGRKSHHLK